MTASRAYIAAALLLVTGLILQGVQASDAPSPGGAGYALLFHDNVIVKENFNDFPTEQLTFEAWISTSDLCHTGAILSYAKRSMSTEIHQRTLDANHFVIFDPKNVLACHDFEYIDMTPDIYRLSCHAQYNKTLGDMSPFTATFLSRSGAWHHLAVTWDATKDGLTQIYQDGLLVAKAITHKTDPLVHDGALMLGGEQDCYGGCTDPHQGFYGMMDEIRIWRTMRTQTEIIENMRKTKGQLTNEDGLVAYWTFDDLDSSESKELGMTNDFSGKGNTLDLLTPPKREDVIIQGNNNVNRLMTLSTGALKFKNNYAMSQEIENMPTRDITIEFWARSKLGTDPHDTSTNERYAEFLSFATQSQGDGDMNNNVHRSDTVFMDDAIRIERYLTEYNRSKYLPNTEVSTMGAISVHINANRQGNGKLVDNWVDFATEWTDDEWHHIAVTWSYESGEVNLYFDGDKYIPFWIASEGIVQNKDPMRGGVSQSIAKKVERLPTGSLVLGQNQECFGGCFSSGTAYDGWLANVRIWDEVLDETRIQQNMFKNVPADTGRLAMSYMFLADDLKGNNDRDQRVVDRRGNSDLYLGSTGPTYQYSYVPLTDAMGNTVPEPSAGPAGHALHLYDTQVLIKEDFQDFPSDQITVEFWMLSVDTCREGVPFSYAHGDYEHLDNAFLVFNYNNWGVSIMEDEGDIKDHNAGFGATDGRWHHIAVTWDSMSGQVSLYDNGKQAWMVSRAQGKLIPPGGTLVIGREQDCIGGCFDSLNGAFGDVQPVSDLQYGAQDFYGVIDQVRIWKTVRTEDDIFKGMIADSENGGGQGYNDFINPDDPNLVAFWKFDEGKGYIVKDETGRGNDLHITEKPDWMVMRWLSVCGDGIKEGTEKCDDGNKVDGDGCSAECKVEPGWVCTPTSPSRCTQTGSGSTAVPQTPPSLPPPAPPSVPQQVPAYNPPPQSDTPQYESYSQASVASASSFSGVDTSRNDLSDSVAPHHKKSGGAGTTVIPVLVVLLVVAILIAVAYRKRHLIYDHFPWVERLVHSSQKALGREPGYDGVLSLDPEADMAPSFVDSQPPTTYQPPGRPGPYAPIPDAGSN